VGAGGGGGGGGLGGGGGGGGGDAIVIVIVDVYSSIICIFINTSDLYGERGMLFIFSLLYEYIDFEYASVPV